MVAAQPAEDQRDGRVVEGAAAEAVGFVGEFDGRGVRVCFCVDCDGLKTEVVNGSYNSSCDFASVGYHYLLDHVRPSCDWVPNWVRHTVGACGARSKTGSFVSCRPLPRLGRRLPLPAAKSRA